MRIFKHNFKNQTILEILLLYSTADDMTWMQSCVQTVHVDQQQTQDIRLHLLSESK